MSASAASAAAATYTSACKWNMTVVKYADGSIYKGNVARNGERVGFGTLRTPIYLYGVLDSKNPSSSIVNWMEYVGEWRDNKPCGLGMAKRYRGDMLAKIVYQGEWANGEPVNEP
jgi:hypothetical protein